MKRTFPLNAQCHDFGVSTTCNDVARQSVHNRLFYVRKTLKNWLDLPSTWKKQDLCINRRQCKYFPKCTCICWCYSLRRLYHIWDPIDLGGKGTHRAGSKLWSFFTGKKISSAKWFSTWHKSFGRMKCISNFLSSGHAKGESISLFVRFRLVQGQSFLWTVTRFRVL